MRSKIIYIAGKMRGLPDYGRHRFDDAQSMLEHAGFIVLNPAWLPAGMPNDKYMPICLAMLDAADCIFMLDNWQSSQGAQIEHGYAKCQGKQIIYEDEGLAGRTEHGSKENKSNYDRAETRSAASNT